MLANPQFAAGEQTTALLASHTLTAARHRGAVTRHADHRAGMAGTTRLVGRRRAALGPDGSAGASARQSHGRQCPGRGGARDDGHRRHAALRQRCGDRARRRADGRETRRTARAVLGTDCGAARQRARAGRDSRGRDSAPILRCAAASTFPEYLGSRATFTLGQFGGHGGRALRTGDVLRLNRTGLRPRRLPRDRGARPA